MSLSSLVRATFLALLLQSGTAANVLSYIASDTVYSRSEVAEEIIRNALGYQQHGPVDTDVRNLSIVSFTWSDCGSEVVKISQLDISPDPIHIPGPVTVQFQASVSRDIIAPLKLELDIQKKKLIRWRHVPCVHRMGSCTYDDVCSMIQSHTCPTAMKECHCPIQKGTYSVPKSTFQLPSLHIPKFLERGHYKVNAKVKQLGNTVLCLNAQFKITA